MSKQRIKITQSFNAPVEDVFNILTDHHAFGQVINANIRRVVDSKDENKNGTGSVRRISTFPAPAFEETVVTFEPNRLMEYVVSKGSPIKNHLGQMEFADDAGGARLDYTIDFEPKLPFVFFGGIIKSVLEKTMRKGLGRLARRFDAADENNA